MPAANQSAGTAASEAYGVSAGLDVLSGVFGFLTSLNASSIARSQADIIRSESELNAQRYAEQSAQFQAKEKVMYLASGVRLAGSPVDALAQSAQVANQNIAQILSSGELSAADEEMKATNTEAQGRNALVGGLKGVLGLGVTTAAQSNSSGGYTGPAGGMSTENWPGFFGAIGGGQ